jgi:lambda family phage tail tape measure protein
MTDAASLIISVAAKGIKTATEALRDLGNQSDDTEAQAKSLGKTLGDIFAGIAVGAFFKAVISNSSEAEQEMAQLNATIASTGGAAGLTSDEIVAMAEALSKVTTFSAGAIIAMESQLLTFTQLGKDVVPLATEAILDLATKMGGDLKGAAVQMGKALNDPIKGVTALSDVGVSFTDSQRAVIKSMVETGDVAGAQKIILAELAVEFGGSARAARDTLGGALESLQNSFGDLLEGGGGNLNDAKSAVEDLNAAISDPAAKEAFATITAGILNLAAAAAGATADVIGFGKYLSELLNVAINGASADNLILLDDAITDLQEHIASISSNPVLRFLNTFEIRNAREELAGLQAQYSSGFEAQVNASAAQQKEAQAKTEALAAQIKAKQDELKNAKIAGANASEQQRIADDLKKAQQDSEAAAKSSAAASASAAAAQAKSIMSQVSALQFQAETVGQSADQVTLLKLSLDGATASQVAAAQAALGTVAAYEAQAKAATLSEKQADSTAAYAAALDAQVAARQNAATVEVQAIGLGQQQAELLKELSELEFEYAKRIQELAVAQGTSTALTKSEYDKRLELLRGAKEQEVAIVIAAEEAKNNATLSATAGAKTAVADYLTEASNVAGQTNKIVGSTLQGLEDQLVAVTQGGKLNFKGLVDSILSDFARAGVKQLLAGGLSSLTGLFGGAAGAAGAAGGGAGLSGLFSSFAGLFDNGGNIPNGKFGIVGEKGPEIVRGPVNVTGRTDTAKMSGGNTIIINQPGVTSTREADRSAGATRRAITSAVNSGSRYA